ncbi:MAG: DUF177 domain-containing protein [Candidatus Omnitrophota bacterium]
MKIILKDIPELGSLDFEGSVPMEDLDLADTGYLLCEPVKVKAKASKYPDVLNVDVIMSGAMKFDCSRCLKPGKWQFKKNTKFNFDIKPTDTSIDITPDLKEEIILNLSLKPLCKSDCKGLCITCGEDLNEGKCACRLDK